MADHARLVVSYGRHYIMRNHFCHDEMKYLRLPVARALDEPPIGKIGRLSLRRTIVVQ
jgi:hypothetical protein